MNHSEQYKLVVESLRLLAASAAEQRRALPDFVVVTDEIVSTFGDAFLLVPQLERAGLIDPDGGSALRAVDQWLGALPQDDSLADACTLDVHPFWTRTRTLAGEALQALGEEIRSPELGHATWVRG